MFRPVGICKELGVPFKLLEQEQCAELIEFAQTQELKKGKVSRRSIHVTNTRNNSVYWVNMHENYWDWAQVFKPVIDLDTVWMQEPFQVSVYNPGERYEWHRDNAGVHRKNAGSTRELTLTCTLQSALDANFELDTGVVDLNAGDAVVFPSTQLHRATAPSTGSRWSLTIWLMQRR